MIIDNSENSMFEKSPNSLRACNDWLSFTLHPDKGSYPKKIINFLGFNVDDFLRCGKGASGYRSMYRLNGDNVRILFDGKKDMGIHVDISGSAIATVLSARLKKNTLVTPFGGQAVEYHNFESSLLLDLLEEISEIATFTRVDFAIDDMGCNYYSCDEVVRLIENNQLVSKFKTYNNLAPCLLGSGEKRGHTVYLGSRQSEIMLRIYDKKLEFKDKYNADCPYNWVRWELELKKNRANEAIRLLLKTRSLTAVTTGILSQYMRFIIYDNPVKSRCSNEPTWDKFLGDAEKMSLYVPDNPKTLDDTKKWIDKCVGASLCAVIEADGGSLDFIYNNLPKWRIRRIKNRDLTERLERSLKLQKQK